MACTDGVRRRVQQETLGHHGRTVNRFYGNGHESDDVTGAGAGAVARRAVAVARSTTGPRTGPVGCPNGPTAGSFVGKPLLGAAAIERDFVITQG